MFHSKSQYVPGVFACSVPFISFIVESTLVPSSRAEGRLGKLHPRAQDARNPLSGRLGT